MLMRPHFHMKNSLMVYNWSIYPAYCTRARKLVANLQLDNGNFTSEKLIYAINHEIQDVETLNRRPPCFFSLSLSLSITSITGEK